MRTIKPAWKLEERAAIASIRGVQDLPCKGRCKNLMRSIFRIHRVQGHRALEDGVRISPLMAKRRLRFWLQMAYQLHVRGYLLTSFQNLKWKHVELLVEHIHRTYKPSGWPKYMKLLRWGFMAINKQSFDYDLDKLLSRMPRAGRPAAVAHSAEQDVSSATPDAALGANIGIEGVQADGTADSSLTAANA